MNKQKVKTTPQDYQQLVEQASPNSKLWQGLLRSFWVGGVICMIGQGCSDVAVRAMKFTAADAGAFAAMCLVFLTAVLTGVGVFDKLGQYAGAGTFVPITGFANAMVSPALEFRREGLVLGLGAKLFTIAGPVLVYGIGSSVIVGIIFAVCGV